MFSKSIFRYPAIVSQGEPVFLMHSAWSSKNFTLIAARQGQSRRRYSFESWLETISSHIFVSENDTGYTDEVDNEEGFEVSLV
jgi:hypothetical protein